MDNLEHLIQVVRQAARANDFELARVVAEHLAAAARERLRGIPAFQPDPAWAALLVEHGAKTPNWDLDSAEGSAGVADLAATLKASKDKKAPRWYAAAMMLRFALLIRDHSPTEQAASSLQYWALQADAQAAEKSREGGRDGGRTPKRKEWAEALAMECAAKFPTFRSAWEDMGGDDGSVSLGAYAGMEVYLESGMLIPFDDRTGREGRPLKKSSFRTEYFSPAKRKAIVE